MWWRAVAAASIMIAFIVGAVMFGARFEIDVERHWRAGSWSAKAAQKRAELCSVVCFVRFHDISIGSFANNVIYSPPIRKILHVGMGKSAYSHTIYLFWTKHGMRPNILFLEDKRLLNFSGKVSTGESGPKVMGWSSPGVFPNRNKGIQFLVHGYTPVLLKDRSADDNEGSLDIDKSRVANAVALFHLHELLVSGDGLVFNRLVHLNHFTYFATR